MSQILLDSELGCPVCGFAKRETMPTDACQFFYECASCKTLLRPQPGDCCVFCSYGSVKCPSMQSENCPVYRALANSFCSNAVSAPNHGTIIYASCASGCFGTQHPTIAMGSLGAGQRLENPAIFGCLRSLA
jgi:hypothetical protein